MATLLHGESRPMYSWWWDSHISPKNSKWLHENLTDMDRNVKAMIKLIEEDADSFARRAEMYYKKRPELIKLVEEFYRAYRALAERYDHATGALRQAHRTMAEAFPNQIPPMSPDESPSPSGIKMRSHTPEMPSPMQAPLNPDDLHKDSLGMSSHFHTRRRNGAYCEESDLLSSKKGLQQLKKLFPSGEGLTRAKFSEGKVRKVLNFKEEEGIVEEKEDLKNEIKRLQGQVSQLSTRNENLMSEITSESQRAQTLEKTIFQLESMKEAALLQYRLSVERISFLETNISNTQSELNQINDNMVVKLNSVEEQCLAMEKVNKSLHLELETQKKELEKRGKELEDINTSIEEEHQKRMQAEVSLMSLEQIHTHSQEEAVILLLEVQRVTEKLKDMELTKVGLEEKISELNEIICNLCEQNISFDLKIKDLHDEMKLLMETKVKLEYELGIYLEENKALQKELFCLKEGQKDLEQRHLGLTDQMELISEKNVVLENSLADANVELDCLREKANVLEASCEALLGEVSTHVVEKGVLVSQMEVISQNIERHSEKNNLLDNSLSDANAELEGLRARSKDLEERCISLCDEKYTLLAEKNTLVSQVENLEIKFFELQDQHSNLGREKDSRVRQVMDLESSIILEKQEHETLISSLSSQLTSLQNQICFLEEEIQVKEEDFETEHQKVLNSLFEIFILQRCLSEMSDKNMFLFGEFQNVIEKYRWAENQSSQFKHKELIQKKEMISLAQSNEVLSKGIRLLMEALGINVKHRTDDDIADEVLVQTILSEIKNLLNSISNAQDKNLQLHLKVETIRQSLEILETKYSELEEKNLDLEREKDSAFHQVLELERSLEIEKQENHSLVLSSKSQLDSLEIQLKLLLEERQVKEDEFETEQQKAMNTILENFILQRCLSEMKERNLILSGECQKLLEASRCSGKLISELKHEILIQKKEMMLLSGTNEKLRSGILLLMKELSTNKECGTIDGTKDEVILQNLLSEIKTILNSVSNAQEEKQRLHLEISIFVTIIKYIGMEKVHLYHELARRNEEVLFVQNNKDEAMKINEQLKGVMQILGEELSDLHVSHQRSQAEICNLTEENHSLSKRFCDLKEKMNALEEESSDFLAKALTLEHLFMFFNSSSTERGLELKLLSDDICSILAVKNVLDEEIRVQNERIRELEVETMKFKVSTVLQEFDLNMARNFCEEFSLRFEDAENLLIQKEIEISEAQEESAELHRKLEGVSKDLDGAKVMIKELQKEIETLSAGIASKDEEVTDVLETNKLLCKKLDRLNSEIEILRRREDYLSSELQKESSKVYECEAEIRTLLNDIQISTVNAAIFEEKVLELIVACENLEFFSMLRREVTGEEIALKNACVDELKKQIDHLEGENGTLKADMNACSPVLMCLFVGVSCLEEHIFSLAKLQERQDDDSLDTLQNKKSSHQPIEDDSSTAKEALLDLQKLIAKVEAVQKVVIDTKNLLEKERLDSNANMEAAKKEIEELKLKQILLQEISKEKYGQSMKDIQLDQVSSSCISSHRVNKNENTESDDQMLELWETAEIDDTEAVQEVKSEHPSSELIAEKELSIDKLEISTAVKELPREWNERFIKKFDSDSQRLSVGQRSLQELKTKLETSERKHPKSLAYGALKVQLKEVEQAILEQVDIICELKNKVEDNFESSSAVIWEKERRQILEQGRRGSEKIGKLELELQKLEYIFLKVEEEEESKKIGCGDRKSSILLSEYIYGKRESKGKRKGPFCRCIRPKTKG